MVPTGKDPSVRVAATLRSPTIDPHVQIEIDSSREGMWLLAHYCTPADPVKVREGGEGGREVGGEEGEGGGEVGGEGAEEREGIWLLVHYCTPAAHVRVRWGGRRGRKRSGWGGDVYIYEICQSSARLSLLHSLTRVTG